MDLDEFGKENDKMILKSNIKAYKNAIKKGGKVLRGILSVLMKVFVMFFIYTHNLFVVFASQNVTCRKNL